MASSPPQSPLHRGEIRIDRHEYDRLLSVALKYGNLTQNLIGGGVDAQILELLSTAQTGENSRGSSTDSFELASEKSLLTSVNTVVNSHYKTSRGGKSYRSCATRDFDQDSDDESNSPSRTGISHDLISIDSAQPTSASPSGLVYEESAIRTVQLDNLPAQTTHSDIVDVVRGGPVIDIYINFRDQWAAVSFVHGEHAQKYFDFAQTTGVYIQGSAIDVSWSSRQYILKPHVASQLKAGASRNLVIRFYDNRITSESIRADLEHIHNLVITSVKFSGPNCHIGTNSIHTASFARTCMMSRFPYRGSRVEWDPDECAQPLEQLKSQKMANQAASQIPPISNRFSLLDLDF